jgi:DNA invertase Pin-like site-specific DNA recombinase
MSKAKRVALYLRVSTDDQTIENQRQDLEVVAARHGWRVVATFADEGISGSKSRDKRPGFDGLCKCIARREVELVAAWAVDRLGRSLQDLVIFLNEIHAKGVDLFLHQQGLDTSTPAGRAMFQMLGVFAEFERSITISRIKAGLARARATGQSRSGKKLVLGRPSGMTPQKAAMARALLADNVGILKISRKLRVGAATIQKIRDEVNMCGMDQQKDAAAINCLNE